MNEELFRKKNIDKLKSPDDLNDYVKVANPGVWLVLVCVIALLVGAIVWGVFGHIDIQTSNEAGELETESIRPIEFLLN